MVLDLYAMNVLSSFIDICIFSCSLLKYLQILHVVSDTILGQCYCEVNSSILCRLVETLIYTNIFEPWVTCGLAETLQTDTARRQIDLILTQARLCQK